MATGDSSQLSEEHLINALRSISLQPSEGKDKPLVQVALNKGGSLKGNRKMAEQAIFSFYFEGTPADPKKLPPFIVIATLGSQLKCDVKLVKEGVPAGVEEEPTASIDVLQKDEVRETLENSEREKSDPSANGETNGKSHEPGRDSAPMQDARNSQDPPSSRNAVTASIQNSKTSSANGGKGKDLNHRRASAADVPEGLSLDLSLAPCQLPKALHTSHPPAIKAKRRVTAQGQPNINEEVNQVAFPSDSCTAAGDNSLAPCFPTVEERLLKRRRLHYSHRQTHSDPLLELSSGTPGGREAPRCGGSAILYRKEVSLLDWGADTHGRIAWGNFQCGHKELALASIYAPNQADRRTLFWQELLSFFPHGDWTFAGDWNSVQSADDSSSKSNLQGPDEALHFQTFCESFQLKDARLTADKREDPKFSRAQKRERRLTWSRIDKFYTSQRSVKKITHHSAFWNSDHIPISIYMGSQMATDRVLDNKKSAYFKADFRHSEKKSSACNTRSQNLPPNFHKKETELKALLRIDPRLLSADDELKIGQLTSEIREIQAWVHHKWHLASRERFLTEGDACTTYFFKKFKVRRKKAAIKHLQLEDGSTITDQEDIKRQVLSNYQQLYSHPGTSEEDVTLRAELLADLRPQVSREQHLLLDDDPTEHELGELLKLIPTGKSPGIDGIGIEIITLLWPSIARLFTRVVLDFWRSDQLHPSFKDGLLFLIPKIDNPKDSGANKPVKLDQNLVISCICLADDTAVYVEPDESSVANIFRAFGLFGRVSGEKINVNKSRLMLIGKPMDIPSWVYSTGVQVVPPEQTTRYLGAQLLTL
ncbi:hypothetical protein R1sor_015949 [Riccia sorocarpa]|uniref:Reverse transcriptase n=1 Tax=Riccia sorocarpa TaxID=122646 RepID=A0ABD3HDM6_9MARC